MRAHAQNTVRTPPAGGAQLAAPARQQSTVPSTTYAPTSGRDLSRIPVHAPVRPKTKLAVGNADDACEREADSIADRIMRMPEHGIRGTDAIRSPSANTSGTFAPPIVNEVLASSTGRPLDAAARSYFEPRFGHNFSQIRVHTGAKAARSAAAINSSAYTRGNDVVLGAGQTTTDPRLLAHELAHVAQNASGADADTIRRSPQKTHFGVFEDIDYHNLDDGAGHGAGVEITILFHPGDEVQADLIGLTQAVKVLEKGAPDKSSVGTARRATSGVGTGFEVDRVEGRANPIYPAKDVKPGGKKDNLGDYDTWAVGALSPAEQAAAGNVKNKRSTGWGKYGYRKLVNGTVQQDTAQLHDNPNFGRAAPPNSEQVFETTALAVAGPQQGTYYGSVEWGWRTNAAGEFKPLPFKRLSEGVPTAQFLTAAKIWNPAKTNLGYVATKTTELADQNLTVVAAVPKGAKLIGIEGGATGGGKTYCKATYNGKSGYVDSTTVRATTIGADTLDLPIPLVYTVTNSLGAIFQPLVRRSGSTLADQLFGDILLPKGTRMEVRRCMAPTPTRPNHYEAIIAQGAYTGEKGYVSSSDVSEEVLGKR